MAGFWSSLQRLFPGFSPFGNENKPSKHKERKKPKKSVLTIDEFCESYSPANVTTWSDYQLRLHRLQESKRVVEEQAAPMKWSSGCDDAPSFTPFSYDVPDDFENPSKVKTSTEVLDRTDKYYEVELRATINEHFENFLQTHRFIKLTDPLLRKEIRKLSKEARDFIDGKGGFQPFLQGSGEFAIVNDTLCLFNDMMNMYKSPFNDVIRQCSSNEILKNISLGDDQINGCKVPPLVEENHNACSYLGVDQLCNSKNIEELDDFTEVQEPVCDTSNLNMCGKIKSIEIVTGLNPNAREYNPSKDSSSEGSQSSLEALKNDLSPPCKPPTLIDNSFLSRVAGMRQGLKVYRMFELCEKPESPDPPKLEEDKQVPNVQEQENASPCENANDYPAFIDFFHSHIHALIEAGDENKLSRAYCCLKFMLQQLAKTNGYIANASSQIETSAQVAMVSQGVMKKDQEIVQLTDEAKALKDLNERLISEKTIIEQQLTEALDKQTELQNKYAVEKKSLKKEIEEKKITFQEELQTLKKKHSALEKDLKLWRQKHSLQMDKEKVLNTEKEILQTKVKKMLNRVSDVEKERDNLKVEFQSKTRNHGDILNEYDNRLQKETEVKVKALSDALLVKEELKHAQISILNAKKAGYLQSFGIMLERVNANIEDLKGGIESMEGRQMSVITSIKILQSKLHEYIKDMHCTRIQFTNEIDEQIKQVESGISLTQLPKLQIPTIPPIPTVHTIMGQTLSDPSPPDALTYSGLQQVPVNQLRASEQLPQNSFQDFSSHRFNQNFMGPYSSSSMPGVSLIKSSVPDQSMSHLPVQPQQNSLFPNFNMPLFGAYQSQSIPSSSPFVPSLPSPNLPTPIGSQLSSKSLSASNHFGSNVAAAFNQKIPPGLFSRPSSSSGSVSSPVEGEQKTPPLFPESKQPKSNCSSVRSQSDSEKNPPMPKTLQSEEFLESSFFLSSRSNTSCQTSLRNPIKKTATDVECSAKESSSIKPIPTGSTTSIELAYSSPKPTAAPTVVPKPSSSVAAEANGAIPKDKNVNLKNGYRKILDKLKLEYPNFTDSEILTYVTEYRAKMGGRLSHLPMSSLISELCSYIQKAKKKTGSNMVPLGRPKSLVIKPLTSCSVPPPPQPMPKSCTPSVAPWAKAPASDNEKVTQNWNVVRPDACCICMEDLSPNSEIRMDCGHQFHSICIKDWLSTQSNCPICRVHLLLPEDYPALC